MSLREMLDGLTKSRRDAMRAKAPGEDHIHLAETAARSHAGYWPVRTDKQRFAAVELEAHGYGEVKTPEGARTKCFYINEAGRRWLAKRTDA